jgi:hypothetical protein
VDQRGHVQRSGGRERVAASRGRMPISSRYLSPLGHPKLTLPIAAAGNQINANFTCGRMPVPMQRGPSNNYVAQHHLVTNRHAFLTGLQSTGYPLPASFFLSGNSARSNRLAGATCNAEAAHQPADYRGRALAFRCTNLGALCQTVFFLARGLATALVVPR